MNLENVHWQVLDAIRQHPGTVGCTYPGINLRIVGDAGNIRPIGKVGNIVINSIYPMTSYINNVEASKKAFTKEGYYPGDLGKLTEDGNLIFEGRKDDMMVYCGVNIYPRELESILELHMDVIDSAVFPIKISGYGDIPFAVVSVRKQITERKLLEWCNSKIGWRKPHRIFFVKDLPRSNTGKVLKRILRKEVIRALKIKNLIKKSI